MSAPVNSLSSQPQDFSTPRKPQKTPGSRTLTQTPGARSVTSAGLRALGEQNEFSTSTSTEPHHRAPTFASIMQRRDAPTPVRLQRTERKQTMVTSKSEKRVPKLVNRTLSQSHVTPSVRRTRVTVDKPRAVVQETTVGGQVAVVGGSVSVLSPSTREQVKVFASLEGAHATFRAFDSARTPQKQGVFKVLGPHLASPEARGLAKLLDLGSPDPTRARYVRLPQSHADALQEEEVQNG